MKEEMIKVLNDTDLAQAAGGKIHYPGDGHQDTPDKVQFVFSVGDRVEVRQSIFFNTKRGTVISRFIYQSQDLFEEFHYFYPCYYVRYDGEPDSKDFCMQYHLSY